MATTAPIIETDDFDEKKLETRYKHFDEISDDSPDQDDQSDGRSVASSPNRKSTRNRRGTIDSRFNEENLGDDFEDTPWCPPTISRAKEYKEQVAAS